MRVALYVRVSSDEQALKGLSVEAQTKALQEWAEGKEIVDLYQDLGISGRKPASKRPQLQRLLRDVEAGKVDLIAFVKLDRWFRSVKEYYKVQDILDAHKVSWTAIQEDYETITAAGKFKVNVMLAVAQEEAERTGERVKAVNELKRSRGEFCSGNTPFGLSLQGKKLAPNDDAGRVKEMFKLFISTGSIFGAQRELLKRGFQIGYGSLTYILDNENYLSAGVITREEWAATRRLRSTARPRTAGTNNVYLFNGILFCECGRRLTGHMAKTNGKFYYHCPGHKDDKTCSNSRWYREDWIEEFIFNNIMSKCEEWNLEIRNIQNKSVDVDAIKRKMDKLTDLYVNDYISEEKYKADYDELRASLRAAESQPKPIDTVTIETQFSAYKGLSRAGKRVFWHNLLSEIRIVDGNIEFSLSE